MFYEMNTKVIFGTLALAVAITAFGATIVNGNTADAQRTVGDRQSQGAAQGAQANNDVVGAAINAAVGVQADIGNVCVNALATDTRQCN
jgi:hypothetical protein